MWTSLFNWFLPSSWFKSNKVCSINPGVDSLFAVIKVLAKMSAMPTIIAGAAANPALAVVALGVLIPNLIKIVNEFDDIPCELAALTDDKIAELVGLISLEFGLNTDAARQVIQETLSLIKSLMGVTPQLLSVTDALKKPV